jgi:hypothetical protein
VGSLANVHLPLTNVSLLDLLPMPIYTNAPLRTSPHLAQWPFTRSVKMRPQSTFSQYPKWKCPLGGHYNKIPYVDISPSSRGKCTHSGNFPEFMCEMHPQGASPRVHFHNVNLFYVPQVDIPLSLCEKCTLSVHFSRVHFHNVHLFHVPPVDIPPHGPNGHSPNMNSQSFN